MKPIVKRTVWSLCVISSAVVGCILFFGRSGNVAYVDSDAEYRKLLTIEQEEILKWIEANGGSATYDPNSELHLIVSIGSVLGDGALPRLRCFSDELTWLSLGKSQISPSILKLVGNWPRIETLLLYETAIDDESLRHLSSLTRLNYLRLDSTRIRGEGLRHLHALPNLTSLHLDNTQINDEGLKHVAGIKSLRELSIDNTAVTIAGLGHLSKMPNLRDVEHSDTAIEYMEYQLFGIYLPANVERAREEREHYEKHGELPYTQEEWERGY